MMSLMLAAQISMEFIGPCSARPLLQATLSNSSAQNVGLATIDTLDRFEADYQGTEAGLNSAFGTPTGMEAMEIISDTEIRSYGWCFEVDGQVPEMFAHHIPLATVKHQVRWFYGYAHYMNGQWVSQCEVAHRLKPDFLCRGLK